MSSLVPSCHFVGHGWATFGWVNCHSGNEKRHRWARYWDLGRGSARYSFVREAMATQKARGLHGYRMEVVNTFPVEDPGANMGRYDLAAWWCHRWPMGAWACSCATVQTEVWGIKNGDMANDPANEQLWQFGVDWQARTRVICQYGRMNLILSEHIMA